MKEGQINFAPIYCVVHEKMEDCPDGYCTFANKVMCFKGMDEYYVWTFDKFLEERN